MDSINQLVNWKWGIVKWPHALLGVSNMDLRDLTCFKENGVKVTLHNAEATFLPQSSYEALTDSHLT